MVVQSVIPPVMRDRMKVVSIFLTIFFLLFSFSEFVSYFFSFSVCKFMVKRCGLEYLIDFELFLFGGENKIKEYF